MNEKRKITAAEQFVACLVEQNIDTVFCVPGESFLAILDALYSARNKIRVITCRHEAGAAHMAEAYGKLTGNVGVAMVTRGPGATHASIGVHCAMQNSTPTMLVIGQVERAHIGREAFQEVNYLSFFADMSKRVEEISDGARIAEVLTRCISSALHGRKGPVVISVPEDVQFERVAPQTFATVTRTAISPGHNEVAQAMAMLAEASRPVVMVGGSSWQPDASLAIADLAARWDIPVCCSFRRQDVLDNRHKNYIGNLGVGADPALVQRVKDADLVLALGPRFGEITTQGYQILKPPKPSQCLIHVHSDPGAHNRIYQSALNITCDADAFVAAALKCAPEPENDWSGWRREARRDYENWIEPPYSEHAMDLGAVCKHLREILPAKTIISIDAGNHGIWPMRFLQWTAPATQLAPQAGAMGCALPAAVAASLIHADKLSICFVGDGGFMMSLMELATAVQYRAAPICLVANNGILGTIRMHQARVFPGRPVATDIGGTRISEVARGMGCLGVRIEKTEEFASAFERAVQHTRKERTPAVLEMIVAATALKPGETLAEGQPPSRPA